MKYALDTNTLIYFFKGKGQVASRMLAVPPSSIAIPAIVAFEIHTGIAKSSRPAKLEQQFGELLRSVTLLPFAHKEAEYAAQLRAELEVIGQPIGPMNTLIAGTALAHGLTLVTHNTHEFSRVPRLQLLDWY